jgi:hypothetical protein
MSNIIANPERVGRFTSSEIYRLCSNGRKKDEPGAPFYSYIEEKRSERKLGRSLDLGGAGKSAAWGEIMEMYVFEILIPIKWKHHGKTTKIHPINDSWAGSIDLVEQSICVGDLKCYQPKNFVSYADILMSGDIELFKAEHPKEYWQLVSAACIHNTAYAEAMLFMPFQSRLPEIREWVNNSANDSEAWRYRFIFDSPDEQLPYIPDGNLFYNELVTFRFMVPASDVFFLYDRVEMAAKLLLK